LFSYFATRMAHPVPQWWQWGQWWWR